MAAKTAKTDKTDTATFSENDERSVYMLRTHGNRMEHTTHRVSGIEARHLVQDGHATYADMPIETVVDATLGPTPRNAPNKAQQRAKTRTKGKRAKTPAKTRTKGGQA